MTTHQPWSAEEDATLKIYRAARKGRRLAAIAGLLPGRSCDAIVTRARYIGLTGHRKSKRMNKPMPWSHLEAM